MKRTTLRVIGTAALAAGAAAVCHAADPAPAAAARSTPETQSREARCVQLEGRTLGRVVIADAEFVASGTAIPTLPLETAEEFCRVDATASTSAGTEIKIAVSLPAKWNGRLAGIGGAGFEGGHIFAPVMLPLLSARGFAAVATNAGHDPSEIPEWALEQPERIVDYGHRANHLGAVFGRALVAEHYGRPAESALFHGCSNGGRDALMLAQRHPDDYDAIAAGAPANDYSGLMSSFARIGQLVQTLGGEFSAAKLKLLNDAVIEQCDARDGVSDGVIERPQSCAFDPAVLQCKPYASGDDCLSKAEIDLAEALYRGVETRDGRQVMPGLPVGSEYQWHDWLTSPTSAGPAGGTNFYRYMVYDDPSWDLGQFDLDRDYAYARRTTGPAVDAIDPDLRPFLRRGGKLLMYHGWDDAAIPAGNSIRYYEAVTRAVGEELAGQTRLFMLPGVAHCWGGKGPSAFDPFDELDRWERTGAAPDRITVAEPKNLQAAAFGAPVDPIRTRPACAWPRSAHYTGSGSIDTADNFVCK